MRTPATFLFPIVITVVVLSAGCKDKTPYPSGDDARRAAAEKDMAVAVEPVRPVETPPRALALIRTARGTTVVAGHDSGEGLVVSAIPGHAWAMDDGTIRVVRVRSRSPERDTPRKRSMLAGLEMLEYGPDGSLIGTVDLTPERTASWPEKSKFIKEAVEAEPDLADEFYLSEKIVGIGSSGPLSAWLVTDDSWLGGAHPSSTVSLLAVNAVDGRVVDMSGELGGRDIPREILRDRYDAACVRDNCGIAAVEGGGGDKLWVVLLCSAFASCEGQHALEPIEPPGYVPVRGGPVLEGQTLVIPDIGTVGRGIVDFRVSDARDMAVVEMALGDNDHVSLPWVAGRGRGERSKTREVRFWVPGMQQAAVIGRLPEIQSVQFIPEGRASMEMLSAVRAISN